MAKEYNAMIESERKEITITHDDFAKDFNFDDMSVDINLMIDYLNTKNDYEEKLVYSSTRKVNEVDTKTANDIFCDVYEKFNKKLDAVILFNEITKYYNFCPNNYYKTLAHKFRVILIDALSLRIGEVNTYKEEIVGDMVQKTFASLFKK